MLKFDENYLLDVLYQECSEHCLFQDDNGYFRIEDIKRAMLRVAVPVGYKAVPLEPTEAQWGGLARDIVMWTRFNQHSGMALHDHLKSLGREIPAWLAQEIPNSINTPPKGTVAACIYKAMLEVLDVKEAS